jgi:hypothetical protein
MTRLLLFACLNLFITFHSFSQNINNYLFSAQSGTYTALTSTNSTLGVLSSGSANEGCLIIFQLGLTFFI